MAERLIELSFPLKGLNETWAMADQPPLTSPYMDNVLPYDVFEERARGGQRPSFFYEWSHRMSTTSAVVALAKQVTYIQTQGINLANTPLVTGAYFDTTGANRIGQDFDVVNSTAVISAWGFQLYGYATGAYAGVVSAAIWAIDSTSGVVGSALAHGSALVSTWSRGFGHWLDILLNSPATLSARSNVWNGARYRLSVSPTNTTVTLRTYNDNAAFNNYLAWIYTAATSDWASQSGKSLHFRLLANNVAPEDRIKRDSIVAFVSNEVWLQTLGVISPVAASLSQIDCTKEIDAVEAYQKVFIANESRLRVLDMANIMVATTAVGSILPHHGNLLTGGTTSAQIVVDYINASSGSANIYGYRISAVAFNSIETLTGTNDDGSAVSFSLASQLEAAPPQWYNWTVYAASNTYGALPNNATIACLYRGRVVLAGNKQYPHQWYMSRQGHPWDFQYVANDAQAPVAGGNSDVGELGDTITALVPIKDDVLIFGGAHSTWILRGDPAMGGSLDVLDNIAGWFSNQSWCFGPEQDIYFFGSQGLCRIEAGAGAVQYISKTILPNLANDWAANPITDKITMEFDRDKFGVLIAKTNKTSNVCSLYWYDVRTQGFFPLSIPADYSIHSMHYYETADTRYAKLYVGTNEGHFKRLTDSYKYDEWIGSGAAIASYVGLGPLRLSEQPGGKGRIIKTLADIKADEVALTFYANDTPQAVINNVSLDSTPGYTATLNSVAGDTILRGRTGGGWAIVKLSESTISQTWAFEKLTLTVKEAGKIR